jgi:HAD superfamily hydrolase (TIGR01484 family)
VLWRKTAITSAIVNDAELWPPALTYKIVHVLPQTKPYVADDVALIAEFGAGASWHSRERWLCARHTETKKFVAQIPRRQLAVRVRCRVAFLLHGILGCSIPHASAFMRFHALATDYDGTLAHDGRVNETTLAALERLLSTGRKLILVTGRELDDLCSIFPEIHLFEWVVAENGALLYRPSTKEERPLGNAPPETFVKTLRKKGVERVSAGRVIVATWEPYEKIVLDTIREMGLELQVIFTKGAVMVLPGGITKATGLTAALKELELSPHEVVGVGDAENDHAFLSLCECAVAVANALPALKQHADLVTRGDHGVGVTELIGQLVESDLSGLEGRLTRHHLVLGNTEDNAQVCLQPHTSGVLIAGPSGSGKSTVATGFLERLAEQHYQFCIIDPEGDYEGLPLAVTLGSPQQGPSVEEILQLLKNPEQNAVVNLVGLPLADRPPFFLALLPRLLEMRARTGRPHWLVVDEAHHLLPASWEPGTLALPQEMKSTLFITVHPNQVAAAALMSVDSVIAVGNTPDETIVQFCEAVKAKPPKLAAKALEAGEVLLWSREKGTAPQRVRVTPSRTERHRHTRKYAEGELPPDRSFYFRGPEGKLNLRAQNLMLFLQMADGVDDETWEHHLREGDYSRWFHEGIKDEALASEAAAVEKRTGITAAESRKLIRVAVERRYTQPASAPLPMPGTNAERTSSET